MSAGNETRDSDVRGGVHEGVGHDMDTWDERGHTPSDAWRAERLLGRGVVDVRRVERVGEIADLAFDPGTSQLVGLLVRPGGTEGPLATLRRALGDAGTRFISVNEVVALNGEVVTADPRPQPGWADRLAEVPRLSRARGLAVVTLRGQRLGTLADLLLDGEGRQIVGYVVAPGGHGAAPVRARRWPWIVEPEVDASSGATTADGEANGREGGAGTARENTGTRPLLVSSAPSVRVGRDLVLVTEGASTVDAQFNTAPAAERAGPIGPAERYEARAGDGTALDLARPDDDQPTWPTGQGPWWRVNEAPAPPAAH